MLSGQHIDLGQRLVFWHEREGFLGREDQIQTSCKLLKRQHEVKPQILIVEQIEERIVVGEICQSVFF